MSKERYLAAAHAMQSGVAAEMGFAESRGQREPSTEPKHLRVGVNAAMVDHSGLVRLLIDKGLITEAEYIEAITEAMETEVNKYERLLTEKLGSKITLG